jgi:hypothetical protein
MLNARKNWVGFSSSSTWQCASSEVTKAPAGTIINLGTWAATEFGIAGCAWENADGIVHPLIAPGQGMGTITIRTPNPHSQL